MSQGTTNLDGVVEAEIITLAEDLTSKNTSEFRAQVSLALEEGKNQMILDCKALKTISSEGLETLLWVIEEVHATGGVVKIAALGKTPEKIFNITQFDRIFDIYSDVIAALKNL
ncbi:MAG: STAS domain-containing protein [Planctomycetota bacterium]